MYQCPKCRRHHERIKIVKTDPKTRKKWFILTCPDCEHESDIEEYKRPNHNPSQIDKYPPTSQGVDDGRGEDDN